MAAKFTPGPWEVLVTDAINGVATYYVVRQDGDCIEHDRNLIAAAPDLYAACEAAQRFVKTIMRVYGVSATPDGLDAQLASALAKARGD